MTAIDDLAVAVGADRRVVAFLADASDREVAALRDAVRDARAARDAELARAVDRALRLVPWPLRRQVRRLLGG